MSFISQRQISESLKVIQSIFRWILVPSSARDALASLLGCLPGIGHLLSHPWTQIQGNKPHAQNGLRKQLRVGRAAAHQPQHLLKTKALLSQAGPCCRHGPRARPTPWRLPALLTLCLPFWEGLWLWSDWLETKWIHGIWCGVKIIKHDTHKIQMLYHNWPDWGLLDSRFSKLASELILHFWLQLSGSERSLCFSLLCCSLLCLVFLLYQELTRQLQLPLMGENSNLHDDSDRYLGTLGTAHYIHTQKFPLLLRLREVKSVARVLPTETGLEPGSTPAPKLLAGAAFSRRKGNEFSSPDTCICYNRSLLSLSHIPLEHRHPFLPVDMGRSDPPREQLGGGWHCPLCKRTMLLPRPFPLENSSQNDSSFPLSQFSYA